jgi:hypothetical protein
MPYGATATYQWQRSNHDGSFTDIIGGTASSYTLMGEDSWCYIRVVAKGTGAYTGTVISDFVGRVAESAAPLTSIGAINGIPRIGETLTAGSLSPAGAKATYQWQSADTADGVYGDILGATANSYTLTAADKDKYIRVVATGSGNFSGTVSSTCKGPVEYGQLTAIGPISGTTAVGQTLTAGILMPTDANVEYQWKSSADANGVYEDIENANASTYTLKDSDTGRFSKLPLRGQAPLQERQSVCYRTVSSTMAAITTITGLERSAHRSGCQDSDCRNSESIRSNGDLSMAKKRH